MFDGETLVHKWGVVGTLLRMVCDMLSGSGRGQGRAGRPVRRGGGGWQTCAPYSSWRWNQCPKVGMTGSMHPLWVPNDRVLGSPGSCRSLSRFMVCGVTAP
jgi:hypothetical protein